MGLFVTNAGSRRSKTSFRRGFAARMAAAAVTALLLAACASMGERAARQPAIQRGGAGAAASPACRR